MCPNDLQSRKIKGVLLFHVSASSELLSLWYDFSCFSLNKAANFKQLQPVRESL